MTDQMSLFGSDAQTRASDRLFLGLFPEAETAGRLAELARSLRARNGLFGAPLAPGRLHVTLHDLGLYHGVPPGVAAAATEAVRSLDAPDFEILLDRAVSFETHTDRRPFVLIGDAGAQAVSDYRRRLGEALAWAGLGGKLKPGFTPHMTLLYDRALAPDQPAAGIPWRATEVRLIHSLVGQTEHRILGRWPLKPSGAAGV